MAESEWLTWQEADALKRECRAWESIYRETAEVRDKHWKELQRVLAENERQRQENTDLHKEVTCYREALQRIAEGAGPFDLDPLQHASNTIEAMRKLASDAFKQAACEVDVERKSD